MQERMHRPGLNPFFALRKAQRAGITEKLDARHNRTLVLRDRVMIEMHQELEKTGCPVFPSKRDERDAASLILLIPEGARDINTLLTQPMDELQRRDILTAVGSSLRNLYDKTGVIPVGGRLGDSLSVAFNSDSAATDVFLVPPYTLAVPDVRSLSPEIFTDDVEAGQFIWEGWQSV